MTEASSVAVRVGDVIAGKYRIQQLLGSGGMGDVVAAMHIELEELRAIKLMQPEWLKSPEAVERFQREARAPTRLKSEHVARVYDVGRLETGAPYIVMEYLEGSDLRAVLRSHGALPLEAAVLYIAQTCDAIEDAHAAGIIHRDLKPANIFLTTRRNGSKCIKVLDFGISKLDTTSSADNVSDLTGTQDIFGSPHYMSPEQMRSTRNVDHRTDIWSIGAIFYELVTGQRPFSGESMPELIAAVLEGRPRPPSLLLPDLPLRLEQLILRCLEKQPSQRPQSAAELLEQLNDIMPARLSGPGSRTSLPVYSAPPNVTSRGFFGDAKSTPAEERTTASWRSAVDIARAETRPQARRAAAGFIAALAILVLGAGLYAWKRANGPQPVPVRAVVSPPPCGPGLDDCDDNADNGCETDTRADAAHCGACDKACGGAHGSPSCIRGVCSITCDIGYGDCNGDVADGCEAALTPAAGSHPGAVRCSPLVMASGLKGGLAIAIDPTPEGNVYWTSPQAHALSAVSKRGGPVKALYTKGNPTTVATDGDLVYWTDVSNATVFSYSKSTGAQKVVVEWLCDGQCAPFGIAVRGEHAFWTIRYRGSQLDPPGLFSNDPQYKRTAIARGSDVVVDHLGLAVDDSSVYWASSDVRGGGAIWRADLRYGSSAEVVIRAPDVPLSVAVDPAEKFIYWTSRGSRAHGAGGLQVSGSIVKAAKDASSSAYQILADSQIQPTGIAVDREWVYWTGGDGTIKRTRKDGSGRPETMASRQAAPFGIAVDEQFIFWVNQGDGSVMRLTK